MKLKVVTSIVLILAFSWPGMSLAVGVGDRLPTFEAETLNGKTFRTNDLVDNQALFVVFWTTWCPQCLLEIPKIKKTFSEFEPKGMSFLAINAGVNDSKKKAEHYVKRFEIPYPVVFDEGSKITRQMGVKGVPTVIIVDKKGIIRYRANLAPDDLAKHFEDLMK